jgi:hypothetical protein
MAGALIALGVGHAWYSGYDHDEIEHLHAAWLIASGQRPFVDFLEQHHPTFWWLWAPVAGRAASPHRLVFWARLFDLACLAWVLASVARIARRVAPGTQARWVLVCLAGSYMFVRKTIEVRPDPLMNACTYAGLDAWTAFLVDGGRARAARAGALLGLAAAVLQKALAPLGLLLGTVALLVLAHRATPKRARALAGGGLALLVGAAVPLGVLAALVMKAGLWRDFWFWNYRFNRYFYLSAPLSEHFSLAVTLGRSIRGNPLLWGAGLAGALVTLEELRRREQATRADDARLTLLALALGYLALLAFNRFPFEQYFLFLLPLIALLVAPLLERAGRRLGLALRAGALACVALLPGQLFAEHRVADESATQEYLLAHSDAEARVAVAPPLHPIFRRDSSYFWYNSQMIAEAYRRYRQADGADARDLLSLDAERWAANAPAFIYVHPILAGWRPACWPACGRGYVRSGPDGVWARNAPPP